MAEVVGKVHDRRPAATDLTQRLVAAGECVGEVVERIAHHGSLDVRKGALQYAQITDGPD
jgi:hypothetical protein